MSKPHILSAPEAVLQGARLAGAEVLVRHPSPFRVKGNFIDTDSFSSALNAAAGGELAGKRSFVFGQVNTLEDMNNLSYMRLPVVMANVSRPLGTFSLKQDHSDVFSVRDAGWLIFLPQNNQEALETIIQAYKVSETVMLPSLVNIDMPNLSETVQLPNEKYAHKFVGKTEFNFFKKRSYIGVALDDYKEYKQDQEKAMIEALEAIEKTSEIWEKNTKRALPLVEKYKLDDADYVIVIAGYHSQTARAAVDKLRASGLKIGLLRIRVLRPFPTAALSVLTGKRVGVIDQALAPGHGGILFSELRPFAKHLTSFISLGNHLSEKHFSAVVNHLQSGKEETVWL